MSDKTEQPTPRRLRRAREEGDSGVSAFAAQAAAFVGALLLLPSGVRALASGASESLRATLARVSAGGVAGARWDPVELATIVLTTALPALAAAAVLGAIAHAVQTGGVVASRRLAPRLDRLDPLAGLRALVSPARLFAVARALAGGAIVTALAFVALRDHVVDLARLAGRVDRAGPVVGEVAGTLAFRAALAGLALAVLDLLVTRRAWMARLRMTKEEVRREVRDAEGDPQIKAARERAHHEVLAQAAVAEVRGASVVIVNPVHLACALRYDPPRGDDAPVVIATGEGAVAAAIARVAREHGVPVVTDVPLARALVELPLGEAIPEALYEAVAAVLRAIGDAPP